MGAKAVAAPAIRTAAPSAVNMDTATTQKVQPLIGANVPLPSRPKPVAPAVTAPAFSAGAAGEWGAAPERSGPTLQTSTEMVEPSAGRGALGTGWESSSTIAAGGGWGVPATSPAPASAGWGTPSAGLGVSWQAPQAEPPKSGGWGGGAPAPPVGLGGASNGLGAGPGGFGGPTSPSPGLGAGPPSGSLGAPKGQMGAAPAGAGGWLGDGGSGAYAAPAGRSGGWLGDDAASPASGLGAISMPSMSPPELASLHDSPALALPDHTVAVDLGTPWEEDGPAVSSNKMIYFVLACLVLSLTGFSGYVWWQNKKLKEPSRPVAPENKTGSLEVGKIYLKKGRSAFKNRKFEEAQSNGELAHTLIADLKVASPAERQAVKQFHKQATVAFAQTLFDRAQQAYRAKETNQAIALCQQSVGMYCKIPGTERQQAQSLGLEGRIYESVGDSAGAVSAYRKAASLNPGGNYGDIADQVRQTSTPPPVQTVQPAVPDAPPVPLSVGGPLEYPSGRPGHYVARPSNPAPAAQPVGPPPRPRPAQTYVPPKKDTTPSWRKRGSDVLPGYNK
ncbi:tetratricopeptide repeat protein [bacterium]|nr:tetratricopeptide repeat protein [bacterium]